MAISGGNNVQFRGVKGLSFKLPKSPTAESKPKPTVTAPSTSDDSLSLSGLTAQKPPNGTTETAKAHQVEKPVSQPKPQAPVVQNTTDPVTGIKATGQGNGPLVMLDERDPFDSLNALAGGDGSFDAAETKWLSDAALGYRPVKMGTVGYSAPPDNYPSYPQTTGKFLEKLSDGVGRDKVGMVTSPTASPGSIDAVTTGLSQGKDMPIFYTTAREYTDYVDTRDLPANQQKDFAMAPKLVMQDGEKYGDAFSAASNCTVVTGGRGVSINDFTRAIENGKPVVLMHDTDAPAGLWSEKRNQPENAVQYLMKQLGDNPDPAKWSGSLSPDWIAKNRDALKKQVHVASFSGSDEKSLARAAEGASEFLSSKLT